MFRKISAVLAGLVAAAAFATPAAVQGNTASSDVNGGPRCSQVNGTVAQGADQQGSGGGCAKIGFEW